MRFALCFAMLSAFMVPVHAQPDLKRSEVFGPGKLWTLHLCVGAEEWPPGGFGGAKMPIPKDFGPAKIVAAALAKHGSEGTLTLMKAAAEQLFRQWDKDADGALSEREVGDAISGLCAPNVAKK